VGIGDRYRERGGTGVEKGKGKEGKGEGREGREREGRGKGGDFCAVINFP